LGRGREEGPSARTSREKVERAAMASSTGMAMSPVPVPVPARPRPPGRRQGVAGEAVVAEWLEVGANWCLVVPC